MRFNKRKTILDKYSLQDNFLGTTLFLTYFLLGLYLAAQLPLAVAGVIAYLVLWILSYIVIHAGACRRCVYYGKQCPVPLEGSLVNKFFAPSDKKFNVDCLVWASLTYILRVALPLATIVYLELWLIGLVWLMAFGAFWILHLFVTGCPRCGNTRCIMNPDFKR